MTKQEFNEAYRVSRRWITVGSFGMLAVWFCIFLTVGMAFRAWFDVHHVVAFLWIVVTLILFVTGVACVAKLVYKRHGLVCPSCGNWIGSQPVMLKTGKCPKCKREMFYDA